MKSKLFSSHTGRIAALLIVDALFFGMTDPADVPSFALIIGFLLFSATLYLFVQSLFRMGKWYGFSFGKHQQRMAKILTGVIAAIVALQSMGQLGGRDILVLIPFMLVAYLYTSYGKSSAQATPVSE